MRGQHRETRLHARRDALAHLERAEVARLQRPHGLAVCPMAEPGDEVAHVAGTEATQLGALQTDALGGAGQSRIGPAVERHVREDRCEKRILGLLWFHEPTPLLAQPPLLGRWGSAATPRRMRAIDDPSCAEDR